MKYIPRIFGIVIGLLLVVIVASHVILNSKTAQQALLRTANRYLNITLQWDFLAFNGATGHFNGNNLSLKLKKFNINIRLNNFRLSVDPIKLIFGRIHLHNLQAEGLTIDLEGESKPEIKTSKKKNSSEKIAALLDVFTVDRAQISRIKVTTVTDIQVEVQDVTLKKEVPFLLYKRALSIQMDKVRFISPKADFFSKTFIVHGSFDVKYDKKKNRLEPSFDGETEITDLLLGFYKSPNPWNTSEPWDPQLNAFINNHYGDNVPDDRAFLYLKRTDLSLKITEAEYRTRRAIIEAAGGTLEAIGHWNRKNDGIRLMLSTADPIEVPLLPLGKARIRKAFNQLSLELKASGTMKNLQNARVQGKLSAILTPPELSAGSTEQPSEEVRIESNLNYRNGTLQIPDLVVKIGQGTLEARGSLNLKDKTFQTSLAGKELHANTIIHVFSSIDIPGTANVTGTIRGDFTNPEFDLALNSEGFGYESLFFGTFKGNLKISNRNFSLTGNSLLAGEGTGNLDLRIQEVFKTALQKLSLKTKFNGLPLSPLLDSPIYSGHASGFFNMNKNDPVHYSGDGQVIVDNGSVASIPIEKAVADLDVKDRTLTIDQIRFLWESGKPPTTGKSLVFQFSDDGYVFKGMPLPGISLEGQLSRSNPEHLLIDLKANDASLDFLSSLLPLQTDRIMASGDFKIDYRLRSAIDTVIQGELRSFQFQGEERRIELAHKGQLGMKDQQLYFKDLGLRLGTEVMTLNGNLSPWEEGGQSDLRFKGVLSLDQITAVQPWIVEGGGTAALDILWQGTLEKPSFKGEISFRNASLLIRSLGRELSELNGVVDLSGNRFQFNRVRGLFEDSPFVLDGWLEWSPPDRLSAANLALTGEELPFNSPDNWRLLTDTDVKLQGSGGNLTLAGKLNIVEGLYYKDYSLSQFILKPVGVSYILDREALPETIQDIHLNLQVQSSGDFYIKNNLADLSLASDVQLRGTIRSPEVAGAINIVEGEVHALGLDFENATGFISFTQSKQLNPYVEFSASHDIQDYEVRTKVSGYTDNLALTLESTPSLNHNDVVSLVAYGRTPDELSADTRELFSRSAIASQLLTVLQRPLSQATSLDIFKLETDYDRNTPVVSRFSVGKHLSERLSVAFTSDLSFDEAFKGISIEYRLLDGLLLKGTKDTGSRYHFDVTWRFQTY